MTIAEMQTEKSRRKWTQVTANSAEEASAAETAGFDMIICNSVNAVEVRRGSSNLFLTAAMGIPDFPTETEILREAFRALSCGADAVMTARSFDIVHALAREDIPVMGHLGLVPRKSTWTGGLRAVGRTASEALELFKQFKRLEEAGGVMVEAEVIPGAVMAEISKRTSMITVSLGSGSGTDVDYLFMEDICGDSENPPRHARAFGSVGTLRKQIELERIKALKAFRDAVANKEFPSDAETVKVDQGIVDEMIEAIEGNGIGVDSKGLQQPKALN